MNLHANLANQFWQQLSISAKTVIIALNDRRLPQIVRVLLYLAIAYLICPFDAKSDFLPGGFIDDSVITPLLLLLGLINIPATLLQESKRLANSATTGVLCLTLFSTAIPFDAECQQLSALTNQPASTASAISIKKSSLTALSYNQDSSEIVNKSSNLDQKQFKSIQHKQLVPFTKLLDAPSKILKKQSHHAIALFSCLLNVLHGHQLQVYDSEDDTDSAPINDLAQISLRPPFFRKGGLLHVYLAAIIFQLYSLLRPFHELYLVFSHSSQIFPAPTLWLFYQTLLL